MKNWGVFNTKGQMKTSENADFIGLFCFCGRSTIGALWPSRAPSVRTICASQSAFGAAEDGGSNPSGHAIFDENQALRCLSTAGRNQRAGLSCGQSHIL